jgi:hypothetical protein
MSETKTNSESRKVREPKERELKDDELALVSAGSTNGGTVAAAWNLAQGKAA